MQLKLRANIGFTDENDVVRTAGDEWMFVGPGMCFLFLYFFLIKIKCNLHSFKLLGDMETQLFYDSIDSFINVYFTFIISPFLTLNLKDSDQIFLTMKTNSANQI